MESVQESVREKSETRFEKFREQALPSRKGSERFRKDAAVLNFSFSETVDFRALPSLYEREQTCVARIDKLVSEFNITADVEGQNSLSYNMDN